MISEAYTIRRSKRAKRIGLRIVPDRGLELVLPIGVSEAKGLAFLQAQEDWVKKYQHWIEPKAQLSDLEKFKLPTELFLQAIHQVIPIRYLRNTNHSKASVNLRLQAGTLFVYGNCRDFQPCLAPMRRFLMELAYQYFSPQLLAFSDEMRLPYQTVTFRGQRTRWGSCSSEAKISLNYKLLFLPKELVDYVMIHELSHLKHMDHSVAFWDLVQSYCPNYRILKKQLKEANASIPVWLF